MNRFQVVQTPLRVYRSVDLLSVPTIDTMQNTLFANMVREDADIDCYEISRVGMTLMSNRDFQRARRASAECRGLSLHDIETYLAYSLPDSAQDPLEVLMDDAPITVLGNHALIGATEELAVTTRNETLLAEQASVYQSIREMSKLTDFEPTALPYMSIVYFPHEVPASAYGLIKHITTKVLALSEVDFSNVEQDQLAS